MAEELTQSFSGDRWIDTRCDEFQQALTAGMAPAIENYMTDIEGAQRPWLLQELLSLETDFRRSLGQRPTVGEYHSRFPEVTAEQLSAILEHPRDRGDQLIGRKLHIYRCVSLVGAGAMGRVYLAMHDDLQRHCALKVLSPKRGVCDEDYVNQFRREGQAAAALIHPNIVTLHAVGEIEGMHFLEMEYIPGRSLQKLIREEGPLPSDQALRLTTMVAEGLAAAHRAGIVHRDVKPDNIMVTRSGLAKIGDFGLASRTMASMNESSGDILCGTPNYMAPELFRGHAASPASDVYALGLCLFQLLIGKLPWHETSFAKLAANGRTERIPDVRELRPQLSPDVAECVSTLTADAPDNRPADAVEAVRLLHAVLGIERDIESLLCEAFGNDPTVTWQRTDDRFSITRQLPRNRRQIVFLESTENAIRERLLVLYSTCCPAIPTYYEKALRQNWIIMHGSLAIRDIHGVAMFVVINAYPRSTVAPEEVRRSVIEIASQADEVERQLTGEDHH